MYTQIVHIQTQALLSHVYHNKIAIERAIKRSQIFHGVPNPNKVLTVDHKLTLAFGLLLVT